MSKPGNSVKALFFFLSFSDIAVFFRPFTFDSTKQLREDERGGGGSTEGMGPGDDEHFVGSVCACFQLTVHLAKKN